MFQPICCRSTSIRYNLAFGFHAGNKVNNLECLVTIRYTLIIGSSISCQASNAAAPQPVWPVLRENGSSPCSALLSH